MSTTKCPRRASLMAQTLKHLSAVRETRFRSLDWEDPLEKEMAAHSSTLAWKILWMEEPGRLQSMGSQRVGHDWATSLHFTSNVQETYKIRCISMMEGTVSRNQLNVLVTLVEEVAWIEPSCVQVSVLRTNGRTQRKMRRWYLPGTGLLSVPPKTVSSWRRWRRRTWIGIF